MVVEAEVEVGYGGESGFSAVSMLCAEMLLC